MGPSASDGGAGRLGVGVWPRAQFCSIVGARDFLRDQIAMVLSGHLINLSQNEISSSQGRKWPHGRTCKHVRWQGSTGAEDFSHGC